jgi:hypothetical protein
MVINNWFVTYATQQDVKDKKELPIYLFIFLFYSEPPISSTGLM